MKITFENGKVVDVKVRIGTKTPKAYQGMEQRILTRKGIKYIVDGYRSYHISLTVFDDGKQIGKIKGTSYCRPDENFVKKEGRKQATRKMLLDDTKRGQDRLLNVDEIKVIRGFLIDGIVPPKPETV